MNHLFLTFDLALKLKELGFNEECICHFNTYKQLKGKIIGSYDGDYLKKDKHDDSLTAPLWQQAISFFRKKYDLVGNVYANASGYCFEIHDSAKKGGTHRHDSGFDGPNHSGCWDKYRDARTALVEKLIQIVTK